MAVVINQFEIVTEPAASSAGAANRPAGNNSNQPSSPSISLEQLLKRQQERQLRVQAY